MRRFGPVFAALVALALTCAVTACVPRNRGDSIEVSRESDSARSKPPVLPAQNPSEKQMVSAVDFDLVTRPDDQDFWSPSRPEAACTAEKIVGGIGVQRLSELGFQPGVPGAGLPQLKFTPPERDLVRQALVECVDLKEAAAAILFGKGRIPARSATCLAEILDNAGVVPALFTSWVDSVPVDAFADDGLFANTLSAAAQVCLDPNDLNWPTLRSPSEEEDLIDADAPAGSRNSNHPDDRRPREEGGR